MTNLQGQIPMRARVAGIVGVYVRAQQALRVELSEISREGYSDLQAARVRQEVKRIVGELNARAQRWAADPLAGAQGAALEFARINLRILKQTTRYLAAAGFEASDEPGMKRSTPLISPWIIKGMASGQQLGARVEIVARGAIREARMEAMARGRQRRVIITGKESHALLRHFLDLNEQQVIDGLSSAWRSQTDLVSDQALAYMLASGRPDPQLIESLVRINRRAIQQEVMAKAARGMTDSSLDIETRVRLMFQEEGTAIGPRRSRYFEYWSGTAQAIQDFVDERGAELVTGINDDIRAMLQDMIDIGLERKLSPYQLSQITKPCVGLTDRDAGAVSNYLTSLLDSGMSFDEALAKAKTYANELRDARAFNIARTELAAAFNQGQLDSIQNAMSELGAQAAKEWETAYDERTCEECADLDGETAAVDDSFSNGEDCPPAHPSCRCSLAYTMLQ
jgi:SPP1 gp7 family putative phage head morphogenesis protein